MLQTLFGHAGILLSTEDESRPFFTLSYAKMGSYKKRQDVDFISGYLAVNQEHQNPYILLCPSMNMQEFISTYEEHKMNELLRGVIFINSSDDYHLNSGDFSSDVPVCVVKNSDGNVIFTTLANNNSTIYCKIYFSTQYVDIDGKLRYVDSVYVVCYLTEVLVHSFIVPVCSRYDQAAGACLCSYTHAP